MTTATAGPASAGNARVSPGGRRCPPGRPAPDAPIGVSGTERARNQRVSAARPATSHHGRALPARRVFVVATKLRLASGRAVDGCRGRGLGVVQGPAARAGPGTLARRAAAAGHPSAGRTRGRRPGPAVAGRAGRSCAGRVPTPPPVPIARAACTWRPAPDGVAMAPRWCTGTLDGAFRRIPIGAFKVGQVAARRAPVVVSDPAARPHHPPSRVGARRGHRRFRRAAAAPAGASCWACWACSCARPSPPRPWTCCRSWPTTRPRPSPPPAPSRRSKRCAGACCWRTSYLRQSAPGRRAGRHRGGQPAAAGGAAGDRRGRPHRRHRADLGRVGHGQGAGGARPAPAQPPQGRPVRRGELRRHPARAGRERAVRPREGRVLGGGARPRRAASRRPAAARCSSTRSASCRWTCRASCCACCRRGATSAWARGARGAPTCA